MLDFKLNLPLCTSYNHQINRSNRLSLKNFLLYSTILKKIFVDRGLLGGFKMLNFKRSRKRWTILKAPMSHKNYSKETFRSKTRKSTLILKKYVTKLTSINGLIKYVLFFNKYFSKLNLTMLSSYRFRTTVLYNKKFSLYGEIGRHARLKTSSDRVLVQVQV